MKSGKVINPCSVYGKETMDLTDAIWNIAKGLPPMPPKEEESAANATPPKPSKSSTSTSLSFSSTGAKVKPSVAGAMKRKIVGDSNPPSISQLGGSAKKKPRKESKNLLSFADE